MSPAPLLPSNDRPALPEGLACLARLLGLSCPIEALGALACLMHPYTAAAGTVIYRRGAMPDGLLLIERGTVSVIHSSRLSLTVSDGDIVGEMAVLDGGPRTATVVALTDIRGWQMAQPAPGPAACAMARIVAPALARKVAQRLLARLETARGATLDGCPSAAGQAAQARFFTAGAWVLRRDEPLAAPLWVAEGRVRAYGATGRVFAIESGGSVGLAEATAGCAGAAFHYRAEGGCRLTVEEALPPTHVHSCLVRWYRQLLGR